MSSEADNKSSKSERGSNSLHVKHIMNLRTVEFENYKIEAGELENEMTQKNVFFNPRELRQQYWAARPMLHQPSITYYEVPHPQEVNEKKVNKANRPGKISIQAYDALTRDQYEYLCYAAHTDSFWKHSPFRSSKN